MTSSVLQSPQDGPEDVGGVWIKSELGEDDTYHLFVEWGPDRVMPLTDEMGVDWCRTVMAAVAAAEHDATLIRHLREMKMPDPLIGSILTRARSERAERASRAFLPGITLTPGVSATTGGPFIGLHDGRRVGQWSCQDARDHAIGILEALETVELDRILLRTLMHCGVTRDQAASLVMDLGAHWQDPETPEAG